VSHSSPFLRSIADFMSVRRYSRRTISTYLYWIKSFIIYHHKRHPEEMPDVEVEHYLTDLAVNRSVAIATQKVALNALAFLYNKFLEKPHGDVSQFRRVRKQAKIPMVLTRQEVSAILSRLHGIPKLVASGENKGSYPSYTPLDCPNGKPSRLRFTKTRNRPEASKLFELR
jgi:site-specific recombinase XerD